MEDKQRMHKPSIEKCYDIEGWDKNYVMVLEDEQEFK